MAGIVWGIFFHLDTSTDKREYRWDLPKVHLEGELAPGSTVRVTLGDLKLPKECAIGSIDWRVKHDGDSLPFNAEGDSIQLTPLMAGAELELTIWSAGQCDKVFLAYTSWLIPANSEDPIRNLTPPRLEGDMSPGGVARVVPGTWHPKDADVVYIWGSTYLLSDEAAAIGSVMALPCERDFCSQEAPQLAFADQGESTSVWAVVSYSNYQPRAYLIAEVDMSFEPTSDEG